MKILPQFIECVAFIGERFGTDKTVPGGTAFFVELDDETDHSQKWTYLVTAAHSLEEIQGNKIYVRVNLLKADSGVGFQDIPTDKGDWVTYKNADVATILVTGIVDSTRHAFQRIPIDLFISAEYKLDLDAFERHSNLGKILKSTYPNGILVEVGDELFFPGLFLRSVGKNRDLPIVRYGAISRMPGDELLKFRTERTGKVKEIQCYLAESLSWGGHSGSPVFWIHEYNLSVHIRAELWKEPSNSKLIIESRPLPPQKLEVHVGKGWVMGLLGLVSAHFNIERNAKTKKSQTLDDVVTAMNAGIAMITPAEGIRLLLMSDEMKKERRERLAEMKDQEPMATADFVSTKKKPRKTRDIQVAPIGRKKFFEGLTKATQRRPSQPS